MIGALPFFSIIPSLIRLEHFNISLTIYYYLTEPNKSCGGWSAGEQYWTVNGECGIEYQRNCSYFQQQPVTEWNKEKVPCPGNISKAVIADPLEL